MLGLPSARDFCVTSSRELRGALVLNHIEGLSGVLDTPPKGWA